MCSFCLVVERKQTEIAGDFMEFWTGIFELAACYESRVHYFLSGGTSAFAPIPIGQPDPGRAVPSTRTDDEET